MSTKMILAALVGTITAFFVGWLVFGILLMDWYSSNMVHYDGLYRNESDMRIYGIFLANLCMASLYTLIFDRWANIRTFGSGFTGGLIIGLLIFASMDLMMWSSMNLFGVKMMAVDIVINAVFSGVIGGVIGLVLGSGKKTQ